MSTPDRSAAPTVTLRSWLRQSGLTLEEAARRCRNMPPESLQAVLDGRMEITAPRAGALQAGTGIRAKFWLAA